MYRLFVCGFVWFCHVLCMYFISTVGENIIGPPKCEMILGS